MHSLRPIHVTLVACLSCLHCGGDAASATEHDASIGAGNESRFDAQAPDAEVSHGTEVRDCFEGAYVNGTPTMLAHYDVFDPVVGSHCLGTNHQDISGVERVVFLGDSVTVGTPPTLRADYYRTKLALALGTKFGLSGPNILWQTINPVDGTALLRDSGDFSSCAKWGARTDDLMPNQLPNCFPENRLDKRTLVVMTTGGNDINRLADRATNGLSEMELWQMTEEFVALQREALDWLLTPGRFPNGVFVVFGNIFEFTDGTGDVQACDVSSLAGFDEPLPHPQVMAEMVSWANAEFVRMAVETQTDAVFMLEQFCGRGVKSDDPSGPCYRGPNTESWLDLTCIHPNPTGHGELAAMFMAIVDE